MECLDDGFDGSGVLENATVSVQEVLLTLGVVAGATSRLFFVFEILRDEVPLLQACPIVDVAGGMGQGIAVRFRLGESGGIDNALSIYPPEDANPRFYSLRLLLHRQQLPLVIVRLLRRFFA